MSLRSLKIIAITLIKLGSSKVLKLGLDLDTYKFHARHVSCKSKHVKDEMVAKMSMTFLTWEKLEIIWTDPKCY